LDAFDDALSTDAWAAPIVSQHNERPHTLSEYADSHVSYLRAPISKGDTSHGDLTENSLKIGELKHFSIRYTSDHDNDCYGALTMCMIGCAGPPTPSEIRMYHTLVVEPAFLAIFIIGTSSTVLR
jgi:hypothetical protein